MAQLRSGSTQTRYRFASTLLLVLNESRFCESSFRVYELFLFVRFSALERIVFRLDVFAKAQRTGLTVNQSISQSISQSIKLAKIVYRK